jgi:hypothetical protein
VKKREKAAGKFQPGLLRAAAPTNSAITTSGGAGTKTFLIPTLLLPFQLLHFSREAPSFCAVFSLSRKVEKINIVSFQMIYTSQSIIGI